MQTYLNVNCHYFKHKDSLQSILFMSTVEIYYIVYTITMFPRNIICRCNYV